MTSFEVKTLRAACKQAKRAHVFPDFRKSYRQYRMSGDSVKEAAWRALYDWDALDLKLVDDGEAGFVYKKYHPEVFDEKGPFFLRDE